MKRFVPFFYILMILLVALVVFGSASHANAQPFSQSTDPVVRGARLYDDWMAVLKQPDPQGNQPIWGRQSSNTISGRDTWRCAICHGWDYQGAKGANSTGPNYTGFPGIMDAQNLSDQQILQALDGTSDPDHKFIPPLSNDDATAIAAFIKQGLIDDNQYIDLVSRKVKDGDANHGQDLYKAQCGTCHGEDGTALVFRYQGQDVSLGTIAVQEPWRFLHRTRFGTARAPEMPIGYNLGWSPQDGRDVLAYAQTLPTGYEAGQQGPSTQNQTPQAQPGGGPARNIGTGILTALGAMATSLGFALLLGAVLVGVILLIVWLIRGR